MLHSRVVDERHWVFPNDTCRRAFTS